ncbi:pseudouridine synthase [Halodesulfovibrio sp.]|uniref:pseudouridine synthase n=1 Tax=Halodesulfovibrio sp. TaxID=1912772 RepID=UPI00345AB4F3
MSEKNNKFSSHKTEDRRRSRTGFGDRSERTPSGSNEERQHDADTTKKRSSRSYFDSNGNYKGRPIDDGDGNGRRNTYNDLPSRSRSGRGGYRRDDRRDRNESPRNRHDRSGSEGRPQRGGYQGRPVERTENKRNRFEEKSDRSDFRRSDRSSRGGDRHRDSRRDGSPDSRGRFESRERGERRDRSDSWGRSDRAVSSDFERRPKRSGYQGRPVERDENKQKHFGEKSDRSGFRRNDRNSRGGDRHRDSRRDDSRNSNGRFESRDQNQNRRNNVRSTRSQQGKRDGTEAFSKRPMRYNPSEKGESQNSRPESRGKMTSNRPSRPEKKPFVPAKPSVPNLNEPLRINKALAFAGICSRRAADDLIAQGVVFVNGKKVEEPGVKIIPVSDVLEVNAERVMFDTEKAEPLYVLLHKPVQTVCTANDPEGRPTVLDILPQEFKEKRIFPVGRLDFFSTGLLLLTNDGELTHRLTHPKWHQNKVYRVRVRGDVSEQVLDTFRKGMTLEEGEKLAPVECKILAHDEGNTRVEMVLTQGINRQIRRMFRDVGMTILNLHRVKLGPIELGELAKGESRELTQEELAMLYKATGLNK